MILSDTYTIFWREMKRYNIRDVTEMEPIYYDLLPWIKTHPNHGHYTSDGGKLICKYCGSTNIKKDGWERRTIVTYQRYRCNDCRSPLKGRNKMGADEEGILPNKPSTV